MSKRKYGKNKPSKRQIHDKQYYQENLRRFKEKRRQEAIEKARKEKLEFYEALGIGKGSLSSPDFSFDTLEKYEDIFNDEDDELNLEKAFDPPKYDFDTDEFNNDNYKEYDDYKTNTIDLKSIEIETEIIDMHEWIKASEEDARRIFDLD